MISREWKWPGVCLDLGQCVVFWDETLNTHRAFILLKEWEWVPVICEKTWQNCMGKEVGGNLSYHPWRAQCSNIPIRFILGKARPCGVSRKHLARMLLLNTFILNLFMSLNALLDWLVAAGVFTWSTGWQRRAVKNEGEETVVSVYGTFRELLCCREPSECTEY